MARHVRWPGQSIFARLIAIMVAMAVCLLTAVTIFFVMFVAPSINSSMGRMYIELSHAEATLAPDREAAGAFADRTGITVAYAGPRGTWSTSDTPIDVATLHEHHLHTLVGSREITIVPAADGGRYAFLWSFGPRMDHLHSALLLSLLGIMIVVVVSGHLVLRRMLAPIRALSEGVARLGEGRFETLPPRRTGDEFGALTAAFNEMVTRLQAMMRARDQLLLDVSHELRSPLTRMKVALALLPPGDQRGRMEADVAEMEAMVGELLELERLRDGRGVQCAEVDLGRLVADVVQGCGGVHPGVEIAPHPPITATVDEARIRTVLRNLIENALKYSLPDSRPVRIALGAAGRAVTIRVRDDGIGISDADLEQIFLPFYRVDRSRSKNTGGYGLGLSLCQRVAAAHGGSLVAQPAPGRGTEFVLTLPDTGITTSAAART